MLYMGKTSQEASKEILEIQKQENDPMMNTDRRIRAKRLRVSFPVQISMNGAPIHGWAEAENLSFSGMLLIANFPLNVSDECSLEFTLPGHELAVRIHSKTVRVKHGRTHDEPISIGVMFLNIDPHVSKIISGFVLENIATY